MSEARYFMRGGRLFVRGAAIDRVLAHLTAMPNGCWIYDGADNGHGYPAVRDDDGQREYVYRITYEYFIGPIPKGHDLDHTCVTRRCANPTHTEPVTQVENKHRVAERRTHCGHGHPYTEENTYIRPDGKGRDCKACFARRQREKRVA